MAHRADDNVIKPCRKCGYQVAETTEKCPSCGICAPGIDSRCPSCGSENYIWKPYGKNFRAAFGGMLILGPIGALGGLLSGSNDTECVCLQCGQGWMPFGFPGGKWNMTRKFKPEKNSYLKLKTNKILGGFIMGFFTKLTENMSTGSDATLSMRGTLTSFNEHTGKGTISWAGKTYQINANPNGIYEVFPYAVPPIGTSVLFNVDSTQRYAIQVIAANKSQRGLMNYLETLKEMKG